MALTHVIVGLGNPGPRYQNTPHNVGFEAVEALRTRWIAGDWQGWKSWGAVVRCRTGDCEVLLAKPATYMNLSGEAVRPLLSYHGADHEQLLVICDDIALPLGRTRLRAGGSSGGQKGLQSIIDHLGTAEFARLRIGVAPDDEGLPCAAERWVLSKWSPERRRHLDEVLPQAVSCAETFVREGLQRAMRQYNGVRIADPAEPPPED